MKDGILEFLVYMAETEKFSIGITVVVDGFLVSGTIISKDEFMESNPITAKMAEIAKTDDATSDASGSSDVPDPRERRFIHLKNAFYFTPGQKPVPDNSGVYCRLRIDAISGFHFGVLELG